MTLSAEEQKAFDEAVAVSTEEINNFYKEDMQKITKYVIERMPHQEILANVMTPAYFPDASEIMRFMMMSPGNLEEKQKLLNETGLWNM